jgi:hypothetical protein
MSFLVECDVQNWEYGMAVNAKRQFSMTVEKSVVAHILNCLRDFDHEELSVSPVLSGWSQRGAYWSSEHQFSRIGDKLAIRFIADPGPLHALLSNGFGIINGEIIAIQQTSVPN